MDNIFDAKCRQVESLITIGKKRSPVYVWSDFHFNDPLTMAITNRKNFTYSSRSVIGLQIPHINNMRDYIFEKLNNLPDNSVFINLGDIGRLQCKEDEELIIKMNDLLCKKNIKKILVMGNHDYFNNNLIFSSFSGREKDIYKNLGFDEVYLGVLFFQNLKTKEWTFLSHKPIKSNVRFLLTENSPEGDFGINYHGHWHNYEVMGSNMEFYKNVCVDAINEPLLINSEELISVYTANIPDEGYLRDPWDLQNNK